MYIHIDSCVYMNIYIFTYMCTYIYVSYTHTHPHLHPHSYIYVHIHTLFLHLSSPIRVCLPHRCVCMYTIIHTYAHAHTHKHTHTHLQTHTLQYTHIYIQKNCVLHIGSECAALWWAQVDFLISRHDKYSFFLFGGWQTLTRSLDPHMLKFIIWKFSHVV